LNLGEETVRVVLNDWRAAPIPQRLEATLGFLEKLTLAPGEVGPVDAQKLKRAGVSEKAIEEAVFVCFLFNVMDRLLRTPSTSTSPRRRWVGALPA
jgi:alkylhydroperoxidase family enzyme